MTTSKPPEAAILEALAWFWKRVDKTPTCWLWTGAKSGGYGCFNRGGKTQRAHRFSYELTANIPEGLVLDHICRVRSCVNPAHLQVVTNKENILRGVSPTAINARKVKCGKGHFEWGNHTNGTRKCLACYREMSKARVLTQKEIERRRKESNARSKKRWEFAKAESARTGEPAGKIYKDWPRLRSLMAGAA